MGWIRHEEGTRQQSIILGVLAVALFMAFVFLQYEAAAVLSFGTAVFGLQWAYIKQAGKKLAYHNVFVRRRILYGGESEWELEFENGGLPIWGGTLKVWFQDAVQPMDSHNEQFGELVEVDVPFTIGFKEKMIVKIPVIGHHRGLARLKKMELDIPLPFGDGHVLLEYQDRLLQEQMVYPKLRNFPFNNRPSSQKAGYFNLNHTLFDDPFQPVGTREYLPTDQFHHIHWKASARMQSYQTKIFTQVANESVLFAVNVASHYATIPNLEERAEELASYIESCYRAGIPYALAVNVRAAGAVPYLYLPSGEGQKQRQKALELLSVLSKDHSTMPFNAMANHLERHDGLPSTAYVLTDEKADIANITAKWGKRTQLAVLKSRQGREPA
ncbi:DUF58 domain-containing protein [Planococcus sp. APC 3906]|uniref:DUF58 domain-containing protein n=1 Tax=Planococcus sp. APC 3906 TaxID=3035194 RepID=UPI0025B532E7|nr:DUF58 domain-containing protein [Planococcus sp. APC 3906]MDN3450230.1 DUF58 domain-containing protein [Planococcus sp. APC 3906]